MAILISDQFTGMTDGEDIGGRTPSPTNTPGNTWLEPGANLIEGDGSGQIKHAQAATGTLIDSGITNDIISVEVDWNTGGVDNRNLIYILSDGAFGTVVTNAVKQGYAFNVKVSPYVLFEVTGDRSLSQLASTTHSDNLAVDTTYKIELKADLKCYRSGTVLSGLTQTSISVHADLTGQSFVGFEHAAFADGAARFDNFIMNDSVGGPKGPLGHPLHGPFGGPVG